MSNSERKAIVIQARMGSSRLPHKMGLKIGDQTVFEFLVHRLQKAILPAEIILATTLQQGDDDLEEAAKKLGIKVYRGDELNVLKRFYDAAKQFHIDTIIRVCADNIYIEPAEIDRLLQISEKHQFDYIANATREHQNLILTGTGLAVEILTQNAIRRSLDSRLDDYHKEHVTPYFYENPGLFSILLSPVKFEIPPNLRLTLDVREDYENIKKIYQALGPEAEISGIVHFLKEQPSILHKMKEISSAQVKGR